MGLPKQIVCCCLVSKSCRTLHGLQHARLSCPSPSPGVCSNSCSRSQWCHPTISPSFTPFSSCPLSFPASGPFPMRHFTSGGQSIGASISASVLPMNIQGWFPLGLPGLISLQSKGFSRSCLLQDHNLKASVLWCSDFFVGQFSHPYMTTGKKALTIQTFVVKVMSLFFNTLFRYVIAFLPRTKRFLISCCSHCLQWFWSPGK